MTILEQIVKHKKAEVEAKKRIMPVNALERSNYLSVRGPSITQALNSSQYGIIAEHKRRSPSRSLINGNSNPAEVVTGYEQAGASAISVLTDTQFFGGSVDDLALCRDLVSLPLLRKDFILDEYQIVESKAYGADVILLIAAIHTPNRLAELAKFAKSVKLEVLLEIHNREELLASVNLPVDIIGVNNRNLKTFEVSINISKELARDIPAHLTGISESGLNSPPAIKELREYGFRGFLMGEHFMKQADPGYALSNFIAQLK